MAKLRGRTVQDQTDRQIDTWPEKSPDHRGAQKSRAEYGKLLCNLHLGQTASVQGADFFALERKGGPLD